MKQQSVLSVSQTLPQTNLVSKWGGPPIMYATNVHL